MPADIERTHPRQRQEKLTASNLNGTVTDPSPRKAQLTKTQTTTKRQSARAHKGGKESNRSRPRRTRVNQKPYSRIWRGVAASLRAADESGRRDHAANDILALRDPGEIEDPVGDHLRMLDDVGSVADDARDQYLAFGQLDVAPDFPLVLVTNIAGLDRERPARTRNSTSTIFLSGRSVVCGPCQLPQQM